MLCRCGRAFHQAFEEQERCPRCRALQLMLDGKRGDAKELFKAMRIQEAWEVANRHTYDWRVIDENGKEVWAADLARRYRADTHPRPMRRPRY